ALGFGTLRATLKLCVNIPPDRSGVPSAGNGPAMRAPVIGAWLQDEPQRLAALTRICTRITHTDPRAEQGALVVAQCTARVASGGFPEEPAALLRDIAADVADEELRANLQAAADALAEGASAEALAELLELERGVGGFINHTVPMAVFCALRYPDFREAVERIIILGGDTDTTAAVVGGIAGAAHGSDAIPDQWLGALLEIPGPDWACGLAEELALTRLGESAGRAPSVASWWITRPPRNLLFLTTILLHALRRLLPPW
ncbi:MAG: ADP-ribosylglycohydrolase, partial [Armatimonadia bacterium]|nr:ADP-ribosylglycohydrolase [Armatimonadia bacterium]